jgi:hypothetical protein
MPRKDRKAEPEESQADQAGARPEGEAGSAESATPLEMVEEAQARAATAPAPAATRAATTRAARARAAGAPAPQPASVISEVDRSLIASQGPLLSREQLKNLRNRLKAKFH